MQTNSQALLTIVGMALVTYMTRAGGLWLMSRIKLSQRTESWLRQLPGTVIISIIAPTVLTSGPAEVLAALATGLVALRTGSLLLAMLVGVSVVWGLRMLMLSVY